MRLNTVFSTNNMKNVLERGRAQPLPRYFSQCRGRYPLPTPHPLGASGISTPPILKPWVRHWSHRLLCVCAYRAAPWWMKIKYIECTGAISIGNTGLCHHAKGPTPQSSPHLGVTMYSIKCFLVTNLRLFSPSDLPLTVRRLNGIRCLEKLSCSESSNSQPTDFKVLEKTR